MRAGDRGQVAEWKRAIWSEVGGDDLDETVLVWESDDGALGGFVSVALRPWAEGCAGQPVPFVEGWYVAEDLRRQGVGRALIEAAEAWAREAGFDELGSNVRVDNAGSLRAHERLGFVATERLQFFRKALAPAAAVGVRVEEHAGGRAQLRWLFELAEDSAAALDAYIDAGRALVALREDRVVGHLQLVETDDPARLEVKSMAVEPAQQRRGVGRALVEAAIARARDEDRASLVVATAAADVGNLRFYQRLGFRLGSVERDAFTETTGYAPGLRIDGIELRDRVWLDLALRGDSDATAR
jgi:GNAT superfamily N-acetyltransferase